ncbi:hypothetical protein ABZ897_22925 [Nonomuraea sp. NPDC046802]|uniref:hypothetical protein n=1 Tax=Nonomuraea sp. NPDC046802 TaxID=3154919 RepID=UPI0033EEDB6D
MTLVAISILVGCLSVMTVRGRQGSWPQGMPVARPRLMAVGGTSEGSQGQPSDAYVIQEHDHRRLRARLTSRPGPSSPEAAEPGSGRAMV